MRRLVIIFVVLGSLYGLYVYRTRDSEVEVVESIREAPTDVATDVRSLTFTISGTSVTLKDGVAEARTALGGASSSVVRYFGNELAHDVDGDGQPDIVFLVTGEAGGSGTFFYAVAALTRDGGYQGSHAVFIGDRIAPQSVDPGEGRSVIVNYADRTPGAPMAAAPSVGKSLHLLLDPTTLEFGELMQNFEGEAR